MKTKDYKAFGEYLVIKRLITEVYPSGIVSLVSDSFDFWRVLTQILPKLKPEIMARTGNPIANKVVIRPDSGDPVKVICGYKIGTSKNYSSAKDVMEDAPYDLVDAECVQINGKYYPCGWINEDDFEINHAQILTAAEVKGAIECLWDVFGGTTTDQGYKVLDEHIGLIYGDSITPQRCKQILEALREKGFASSNVVFGIGSFTYQYCTRDTYGFAVKATYGEVNGQSLEIFKDPVTDNGTKKSAKGLLKVVKDDKDQYKLIDQVSWNDVNSEDNELKIVFKDGKLVKDWKLSEIRDTLNK